MSPSEAQVTLAIDAMGGDNGPEAVLDGLVAAIEKSPTGVQYVLVGDERVLSPLVDQHAVLSKDLVRIHHASQVIGMDEKPVASLKSKKDSSIVRALELVREEEADAMLSCGNTGSLMAGGTIKLRTLEGIDRPALGTIWPGSQRYFVLLDAGANPESKPIHIVHNAVLGLNYARIVLGINQPKLGLLSIGTEESKGNELIQESHHLLKQTRSLLNYQGLIEGFQMFENEVDVVVCDGFVGNVVLKACESLCKMIGTFLDEELRRNALRKTGALLSKGAFKGLKQRINPEHLGGAPLLGLRKPVVKAHGSSNKHQIEGAIRITLDVVRKDMIGHILTDAREANELLQPVQLAVGSNP
ncbi:MAG: phosphate acyltransferase PlsX [Opitutae bacterium]|nr:phosphate acyltransferase PlsX [Opitutae bacterium]|tara:strand:- start:4850 stop:5920 length:1071 start_codon:yes stop_codon:yes gene_type:complete